MAFCVEHSTWASAGFATRQLCTWKQSAFHQYSRCHFVDTSNWHGRCDMESAPGGSETLSALPPIGMRSPGNTPRAHPFLATPSAGDAADGRPYTKPGAQVTCDRPRQSRLPEAERRWAPLPVFPGTPLCRGRLLAQFSLWKPVNIAKHHSRRICMPANAPALWIP